MTDFNYWKNQYKDTWGQSSQRESAIAQYLEEATGRTIKPVGLGAGSTDFLSGSAADHGHAKGDADLVVVGTTLYLEVTGPLVPFVDIRADLWVRPDKVENARRNRGSHETWVVHHLPKNNLIRVVHFDDQFWQALDAGEFPIVTHRIRGVQERYRAIPATHSCVQPYSALIDRLKQV